MFRRLMYETGRMLRETGQALDRVGLRALENPIYREPCKCFISCLGL